MSHAPDTARTSRGRLLFAGRPAALASYPLVADRLASGQGGQATANPAPRVINDPTDPALQRVPLAGDRARPARAAASTTSPSTRRTRIATSSASPSSGIWRTMNNGTTFDPIFDTYGTGSIGDLALAPSDPNILYVGTGEANNRQSSARSATASGRARTRWRRTPATSSSNTSACARRSRSRA